MKMSFKLALLCLGLSLTYANAQVGMPTNNPNKDAVLDLNRIDGTSAKGLLLPKVALTGANNAAPMTAHVAGMHIWNTATVTGTNAVTPGEYFNDGTKWVRVSSAKDAWIQDGNNNGALKAIGTNDAFDLPIETNGVEKMRITSNGQVLVNTTTPLIGGTTSKLQINNGTIPGAIQLVDGTQGEGKVLTSDANGIGTWKISAVSTEVFSYKITYPASFTLPLMGQTKNLGSFQVDVSGIYRVTIDLNIPTGYMLTIGSGSNNSIIHYSQSPVRFLQHTLVFLQAGLNNMSIYNDAGTNPSERGGPYCSLVLIGPVN